MLYGEYKGCLSNRVTKCRPHGVLPIPDFLLYSPTHYHMINARRFAAREKHCHPLAPARGQRQPLHARLRARKVCGRTENETKSGPVRCRCILFHCTKPPLHVIQRHQQKGEKKKKEKKRGKKDMTTTNVVNIIMQCLRPLSLPSASDTCPFRHSTSQRPVQSCAHSTRRHPLPPSKPLSKRPPLRSTEHHDR